MIRTLKIVVLAGMAMAALSAVGAASAQAAEFHCSVEPCRYTIEPDEVAGTKTAHHVLVFTNSAGQSNSLTCNRVTGHGTSSTKTTTTMTLTGIAYDTCTFVGQTTTVKMNGCHYELTSHGAFSISCPVGQKITVEVPGCKVEIGAQSLTGATYSNIGTPGTTSTRVTVSLHIPNMAATMTGTQAACGGVDPAKTPITCTYSTGNFIVVGEPDVVPTAGFAEYWWA